MAAKKQIDDTIVQRVSMLSRIRLSDRETEIYGKQLSDILAYINKLKELDTSDIPPTSHPIGYIQNVFREDKTRKSLPAEEALKNAPKRKDNFFSVPKIIE